MAPCSRHRPRAAGFTYVGLLIAVAIVGAGLGAASLVSHTVLKREREKELLFIGNQFRQALARYALNTPPTAAGRTHPRRIEDLLLDDRHIGRCRYLRKIFADPMTGRAEWGLVTQADGGIVGVHSLSDDEPLKKSGFRPRDGALANKTKYSEWLFLSIDKPSAAPANGGSSNCQ